MTGRRDTEHREQAALFEWAAYQRRQRPELSVLFAIPNGGHRSKAAGARLKAEGVRAGIPDVCLPVARCGAAGERYGCLWIEMKSRTGRLSPAQAEMRRLLVSFGGAYALCRSWLEAAEAICAYLDGRHEQGPAETPCEPEYPMRT